MAPPALAEAAHAAHRVAADRAHLVTGLKKLASGGLRSSQVAWELLVWSPLQGLSTALVGIAVLWFFRGWLSPRRSTA